MLRNLKIYFEFWLAQFLSKDLAIAEKGLDVTNDNQMLMGNITQG